MPPTLFPEPAGAPDDPPDSSRPLTPEQADKLPHIHRLLLGYYGQPEPRALWDPLTQFIYSLLSSRTRTTASQQVMRDLERTFHAGPGNWEPVRDASVSDLTRAIDAVTFPEVKAPRLKLALEQITARVGSLTLDFLARYRTDKIRAWLEQFEGVGPQISAAVVNFSTLRRRALCVDANHLRVIQRLCVVPRANAEVTEGRLMRLVPETWDAAVLDEHHSLIKLHAQTLCTFSDPKCDVCPLLKICPTGQRNMAELHLTAPPA
jgi:endonuclease-3